MDGCKFPLQVRSSFKAPPPPHFSLLSLANTYFKHTHYYSKAHCMWTELECGKQYHI